MRLPIFASIVVVLTACHAPPPSVFGTGGATNAPQDAGNDQQDVSNDQQDAGNDHQEDSGGDQDAAGNPPPDGGTVHALLFGGEDATGALAQTWLWDGHGWTEQSGTLAPSARSSAVAGSLDGKVVVFGGANSPTLDAADSWIWQGTTWQAPVSSGPGGRHQASAAVFNGMIVVFGGMDANRVPFGDTWSGALVGNSITWTKVANSGPTPRAGAAMATLGTQVVLFGGYDPATNIPVNETWIWNGSVWSPQMVAAPPARAAATLAAYNDALYLFGGYDAQGNVVPDTWMWNGGWKNTNLPGPSARSFACATAFEGGILLFGGLSEPATQAWLGDTWVWDAKGWHQPPAASLSPRGACVMGTY